MKIILGSGSPSRKTVLERMGFEFEVIAPDIDERAISADNTRELPLLIAQAKMDEVLKHVQEDAIVITSDQVMIVDGIIREKPESKEQAYGFIKSFSNKTQIATSGTVVVNTKTGKRISSIDQVTVTFDPIPEQNIKEFIDSDQAKYFAGALCAEHKLFSPYIHYDGEWESLLGLPKAKLLEMMEEVEQETS
jgi:septum formation protein